MPCEFCSHDYNRPGLLTGSTWICPYCGARFPDARSPRDWNYRHRNAATWIETAAIPLADAVVLLTRYRDQEAIGRLCDELTDINRRLSDIAGCLRDNAELPPESLSPGSS